MHAHATPFVRWPARPRRHGSRQATRPHTSHRCSQTCASGRSGAPKKHSRQDSTWKELGKPPGISAMAASSPQRTLTSAVEICLRSDNRLVELCTWRLEASPLSFPTSYVYGDFGRRSRLLFPTLTCIAHRTRKRNLIWSEMASPKY